MVSIDITNKTLNILRYFDIIFINYFEIVSEFKYIIADSETFVNELRLLESNKQSMKIYFWVEIGN